MEIGIIAVQFKRRIPRRQSGRQPGGQTHIHEIEVGKRHPDGFAAQVADHRKRQAENGIIGFAIGTN